jgi:hypothetical protein
MEQTRLAIAERGSTGLEAWFDVELMQADVVLTLEQGNRLAQLAGRKRVVA